MGEKKSYTNILVVDDIPENLQLLMNILKKKGYKVRPASSGSMALMSARKDPPDLILLDIKMPEMDGYEVCRTLKNDSLLKEIPVIFLSAINDTDVKLKAFKVGGVDYITKPFQIDEVVARVHTHLALKKAHDELKKQNSILEENVRLREDIERITRHDIKGPLCGIINYPFLILEKEALSHESIVYLKEIEKLGYQILQMINLSLDLYKMEQGSYVPSPQNINLYKIIKNIEKENKPQLETRQVAFQLYIEDSVAQDDASFMINSEELLCYSMLINIIKNAIEASPPESVISVRLSRKNENEISIRNQGSVAEQIRDIFFEKYVTYGKKDGTGLGTYSARLIAETLGGHIELDTQEQDHTTITIYLPVI